MTKLEKEPVKNIPCPYCGDPIPTKHGMAKIALNNHLATCSNVPINEPRIK